MKLQEKLDIHRQNFIKKVPVAVLAVMQRATEDLRTSGILERAVKAGATAPAFALQNYDGRTVSLSDLLAQGALVLGFYRGRW